MINASGAAGPYPGDGSLSDLTIAGVPGVGFTGISLNPNALADGTTTVIVNEDALITHTLTIALGKSGENRIFVNATGSDVITSLTFVSNVGISDIKQVRIGGVQVVPEPASMAPLGPGALGLVERRKKAKERLTERDPLVLTLPRGKHEDVGTDGHESVPVHLRSFVHHPVLRMHDGHGSREFGG